MPRYEYKVVPAPQKGLKGKGVKGPEARFSFAVQELMNGLSGYGWEYQRAETLPSIERSGLTGSTTEWRNVLVFRRPRAGEADEFSPELLPAPQAVEIEEELYEDLVPDDTPETAQDADDEQVVTQNDNGVEDTSETQGVGASLAQLASNRKTYKSDS